MRKIVPGILLIIICFVAFSNNSSAATSKKTPSGITLSPAIVKAEVAQNEPQHRLEFKISNNENSAKIINISTADFNTLDESGGLVFVGTNPTQIQKKYGLATWLTLPQTTVTIQPKQTVDITAFILNQPSLAPGGHYGALMLALADNAGPSSKNKVSIHPIASSLLFINKEGGDIHKLSLSNVYISHSIFSLPDSVTLRFHNDGNTHLIPRGVVTVSDSGGKLISKGIINENSGIILPQTNRRYSVPLTKVATATTPGKYKVEVDFRFDGYDQFRSYRASVFLLTPPILILISLILIAAVSGAYFLLKNGGRAKHISRIARNLKRIKPPKRR
jgi:hypothetical protein